MHRRSSRRCHMHIKRPMVEEVAMALANTHTCIIQYGSQRWWENGRLCAPVISTDNGAAFTGRVFHPSVSSIWRSSMTSVLFGRGSLNHKWWLRASSKPDPPTQPNAMESIPPLRPPPPPFMLWALSCFQPLTSSTPTTSTSTPSFCTTMYLLMLAESTRVVLCLFKRPLSWYIVLVMLV